MPRRMHGSVSGGLQGPTVDEVFQLFLQLSPTQRWALRLRIAGVFCVRSRSLDDHESGRSSRKPWLRKAIKR